MSKRTATIQNYCDTCHGQTRHSRTTVDTFGGPQLLSLICARCGTDNR